MSRECRMCRAQGRKRQMADGLRHVHELPEGGRYRYPGEQAVHEVVRITHGTATVTSAGKSEKVQFTTVDGRPVNFERPASSRTRRISPTAEVEPLIEVAA